VVTTNANRTFPAVRRTTAADAALLPSIERSAGEAFRAIDFLAWLADGEDHPESTHLAHVEAGTSWVAVDDADIPIGFLIGDWAGDIFHIVEISVRLDWQRSGSGSALLSCVIAWAREQGLRGVTLTTFRDVAWNAPFYRRFSFHEIEWQELERHVAGALGREAAIGLPRELRCAMRLDLIP
jgi:GNAT superfamily N-acetyltransferase